MALTKSGPIRLNKFLADCGAASRRGADQLISEGQVQVNGKTVFELACVVDPSADRVTLNGKPVRAPQGAPKNLCHLQQA